MAWASAPVRRPPRRSRRERSTASGDARRDVAAGQQTGGQFGSDGRRPLCSAGGGGERVHEAILGGYCRSACATPAAAVDAHRGLRTPGGWCRCRHQLARRYRRHHGDTPSGTSPKGAAGPPGAVAVFYCRAGRGRVVGWPHGLRGRLRGWPQRAVAGCGMVGSAAPVRAVQLPTTQVSVIVGQRSYPQRSPAQLAGHR